jgi:hypothetical protein
MSPRPTKDVEMLNPYENTEVLFVIKKFYEKFYNDDKERIFVFGINPGRFGGGLTGIAFTDPLALKDHCGIENSLGNRKELSSKFIYTVAERFGGADNFFSSVFLTALFPFAIIKDGKNYNYYDEKSLANALKDEIVKTVRSQIEFGAKRDFAILLGKKNAEFFSPINEKYDFFEKIFVLEHPRYIMQYKLEQLDNYVKKYIYTINKH